MYKVENRDYGCGRGKVPYENGSALIRLALALTASAAAGLRSAARERKAAAAERKELRDTVMKAGRADEAAAFLSHMEIC